MADQLRAYASRLEALATEAGLEYFPVDFELVPPSFMMEVAVYGLPVRMPHWSFGVRYIYQLVQHRMGHSHLFEVVFPGNPGRAYLANTNSVEENTLVTAHVLGHADFSRNNQLFVGSQEQVGYHIVEQAANHAHHIAEAIDRHGQERVERVLDAALALEQHIDIDQPLRRPRYPEYLEPAKPPEPDAFRSRYGDLPSNEAPITGGREHRRAPLPPHPERDLLWLIAQYGPELEDWERDIFLAVREESFYFYPVFACQIMNEGWASYWHAELLQRADFLPQQAYLDAIKTHSDVVRPYAGERQVSLAINPYHVGFTLWRRIVADQGMEQARRIMREEDDFGFIRNHLTEELAEDLELFRYVQSPRGEVTVQERDIHALRETLLAHRFNFGSPRVRAEEVHSDGTLVLVHDHQTDSRGLDLERAGKVLQYIRGVWRRPVIIKTVDAKGHEQILKA